MKSARFPISPNKVVLAAVLVLGAVMFLSILRAGLFGEISEEKRLWFEVTFLLLAAITAELLVRYLRQPSVIALMLVGIAISPPSLEILWPLIHSALSFAGLGGLFSASIHLVGTGGVISVFAQLGAIFLLFEAGMHGRFEDVFNLKNFIVALFGVVVPFAGGYAYSAIAGGSFAHSMFIGAALTATSVGVTVSVLMEFGALSRPFAKTILGAAVIDDVLALLALSFVQGVSAGGAIDAASFAALLFSAIVFIAGGLALGFLAVERFSQAGISQERRFLLCLAVLFFYSFAAEFIGLSAIVGAFVAGMVVAKSRYASELLSKSGTLAAVFTPMFFLSLGMFVDVRTILPALLAITLLTLVAFATKIIGCGAAALLSGSSKPDAAIIGIGMVPRGEIALIIALLGLQSGVFSATDYAVVSGVAFATTILPPYFLKSMVRA